MNILKKLTILVLGAILMVSCNLNEAPIFDDSEAFVAFRSSELSLGEEKTDTIKIPVLLTSLAGLSSSVDFEIVTAGATAIEGKHFKVLNTSKTLTFTKDAPTQNILVKTIDNATFDGDVSFSIKLNDPGNVKLGDSKKINIKINDDEHPLLFILGSLTAKGTSYYNGGEEWTVVFDKDATDLKKVWIKNFVNGGSSASSPIYGVVNDEKTEIKIPVGQVISVSTSYPKITLRGFYGPDGDEEIPTGGFITGSIAPDGLITIADEFGSYAWTNVDMTAGAGWFNIYKAGVTHKKQ